MKKEKHIRVGFFEKFKGKDSILISVDIYGILELEKIFQTLQNKALFFDLSKSSIADSKYNLKIIMSVSQENLGLIREDKKFTWILSKEKWAEFEQKTRALYKNKSIGHQYLDSDNNKNNDLQVILSLNEYPKEFWKKHFKS